jgi:hypothetical protein
VSDDILGFLQETADKGIGNFELTKMILFLFFVQVAAQAFENNFTELFFESNKLVPDRSDTKRQLNCVEKFPADACEVLPVQSLACVRTLPSDWSCTPTYKNYKEVEHIYLKFRLISIECASESHQSCHATFTFEPKTLEIAERLRDQEERTYCFETCSRPIYTTSMWFLVLGVFAGVFGTGLFLFLIYEVEGRDGIIVFKKRTEAPRPPYEEISVMKQS